MKYIKVDSPLDLNVPRLFLYYLQRVVTTPSLRSIAIFVLRHWISIRTWSYRNDSSSCNLALVKLRTDGISNLGEVLPKKKCNEVLRYLYNKKLSHRRSIDFTVATTPDNIAFGNHSLTDLVNCPHILELANSPALLELARNYLGCTPTITGLSARWSFPAESANEVVQKFHRDSEDWLALRIMVYLTDVDDDSGPHIYVKRTHLDKRTARLPVHEDILVYPKFGSEIVRQTGAQGFGFAVDTAGLHKGEIPAGKPRLLLSVQYSILPCFLYEYEPETLPKLLYDPYINRLIVKCRRDSSRSTHKIRHR